MYFNARSIVNKLDELHLYIDDENPDIIGITETWLHEQITDTELNLPEYTIYRHDRKNKSGGGVVLLIKNNIKSSVREDLSKEFEECIWCDIINKDTKILFGVCYRSTNIELRDDNKLFSLLNKVSKENLILVGDFNYEDSIDWGSNTCSTKGKLFLECITKNFLYQHVDKATRGNNILDLLISTNIDQINNVEIGEQFGNSDHQIIRFIIPITYVKENTNNKMMYNYIKGDYNKACNLAHNVNWDSIITSDVIESWTNLKKVLINIRNQCIPFANKKKN